MEINKFIMKNIPYEEVRKIIFMLKKKTNGKIIERDEFFNMANKTIYYVLKVLDDCSYSYYQSISEIVFHWLGDLIEICEQGAYFKTII